MQAIRASLPAGLRWRLAVWVAGVMLISAAAIFVVVYNDTGTELSAQTDRDIAIETSQLAQALRPLGRETTAQIAAAARRYMQAQPYTGISALLFAVIPGAGTISNHPEIFRATAPEDGESPTTQAAENSRARRVFIAGIGYSTARFPDVGPMRIHERAMLVGATRVIAGAGESLYTVERAQHGIARSFILAGAVILALALVASYLAGARVSAPLRAMVALAARIDAGDLAPRIDVSNRAKDEFRVLGVAFNHMLDRLEAAFRGQREFVADASHELRTPLTVMRGQLEVLAVKHNPSEQEVHRVEALLQAEISRMARLVEDLLLLARAEQTDFLRPEPIDLKAFTSELWQGVTLTAERRFELGPVPEGTIRGDHDRLAQALRNLLQNAVEHTSEETGLVRLEVERTGSSAIRFAVIDDGPGIPAAERERVFERFHRTDQARNRSAGGAGLGLAIVRAIAEAHGGHVRATDAGGWHGAKIVLVLPGFQPSRPGPIDREQSQSTSAIAPAAPRSPM